MSNTLQQPHEPTLHELASELSRLHERVEDLEDLRDLLAAERAAQDRPGIPWEQAKKSSISVRSSGVVRDHEAIRCLAVAL